MNCNNINIQHNQGNKNTGGKSHFDEYLAGILLQCINSSLGLSTDTNNFSQLNELVQNIMNKSFNNQPVNLFINEFYGPSVVQPINIQPVDQSPCSCCRPDESTAMQFRSGEDLSQSTSPPAPVQDEENYYESEGEQVSEKESISQDVSPEPLKEESYQTPVENPFEVQHTHGIKKQVAIQPEIIETHEFVIVKIKMPQGINEDDFRISINPGYMTIKWRLGYIEQVIRLPQDIMQEKASASIHNGLIEVKIPREPPGNSREINIDI